LRRRLPPTTSGTSTPRRWSGRARTWSWCRLASARSQPRRPSTSTGTCGRTATNAPGRRSTPCSIGPWPALSTATPVWRPRGDC